ncbi:MAG: pyruvate formate lyase family protein [Bacteroidota bacterium]
MNKRNFATELKFTEVYKKHFNDHPAIREAKCLGAQYPDYFAELRESDLFAGRIEHGRVGFSIDEWGPTAFGYYCQFELIECDLKSGNFSDEEEEKIYEMMNYWKNEDTSEKLRRAYPQKMAKYLPSDDWMNTPGIAFPLYRLTGGNLDFNKLLNLGIPGLFKEIESMKNEALQNGKDESFYEGMRIAVDVLVDVCKHYENQALDKAKKETDLLRKNELLEMAGSLQAIVISKPKTFREAIQLFWLYANISDIRNYGRMDVYLGNFLVNDIQAGILTEDFALKLLQSLWQMMADKHTVVHNRVIIGGLGRSNEKNADRFAMLAMEATRTVKEIEPQLSLRFYEGMNPDLFGKALDVIGEGRTFPILYNDNVNIDSVVKAFGFNREEAEQYIPYGCGEYILEHKSFGTPSGVINLLKALEVTLRNGREPLTGKTIGLQLGEFKDFKSFEDLLSAYKKQVEFFVELLAEQEALEYKTAGETAPFLFVSLLYDDCLEKGNGIFSGGIRYLGGTIETYGNTNTADSLTAIKEFVYVKKEISPDELLKALDANFNGYSLMRNKLLSAPKYGNDNDTADNMLLEVHNHVCNFVRDQAKRVGLHSYLVVIINNSANTLMGHSTSASADGRLNGTHMNNGNAPSGGSDKEGVTAMLNSVVKPSTEIHAGAVQNMKFSRDLFFDKRDIIKSTLKTYFNNGGAQAMITVVNRGDLEKALTEPEKYKHIFVRVGGFTARFVELSLDVQQDILSRTLY